MRAGSSTRCLSGWGTGGPPKRVKKNVLHRSDCSVLGTVPLPPGDRQKSFQTPLNVPERGLKTILGAPPGLRGPRGRGGLPTIPKPIPARTSIAMGAYMRRWPQPPYQTYARLSAPPRSWPRKGWGQRSGFAGPWTGQGPSLRTPTYPSDPLPLGPWAPPLFSITTSRE
ncbi:hypothetical protein GWK47_023817 [Chionoecetes opilio]|uniref:Uncharacterized protein n=1 Tax=Chionoecetes opilio TaxID=41210 RepID=A0A8J4XQ64_CHIOP|nr:hypothetical protein GWK47_023817 [Chionoecetes opilio]